MRHNLRGFWPGFLIAFILGSAVLGATGIYFFLSQTPPPASTGPARFHQSDVLYHQPGDDNVLIRCPICKGKGWTNYNLRGLPETCTTCGGSGQEAVRLEGRGLQIVPDDQPL